MGLPEILSSIAGFMSMLGVLDYVRAAVFIVVAILAIQVLLRSFR